MKFHAFHWSNFLESSAGQASVAFFSNLRERYATADPALRQFLERWAHAGLLGALLDTDTQIASVHAAFESLAEVDKHGLVPSAKLDTTEGARAYFEAIAYISVSPEDAPDKIWPLFEIGDVSALSVALYCLHPDFFFPYYFYPRFHCLVAIFEEFGIYLPPVPAKRHHDARFLYYAELCQSLSQFAVRHEIEPRLMPSFLYDFAPNVLRLDDDEPAQLPAARRAWFVGGGIRANGDFDYLDAVEASSKTFWQGNKDTLPGDIVVMYCLSPRSSVHSVWRALRNGTTEPFRGFYNTIWIGSPQKVPSLTLQDLRDDPVLSEMPLVRQNMQGINGRRIEKRHYDRLAALWTGRGMDPSLLPMLDGLDLDAGEVNSEREVEQRILEPLLAELGFGPEDWERQVKVRLGRSDRAIPDYVIFPRAESGRVVAASWVWEAKFSIDAHQQLERDFGQAVSYARLLGAQGTCLLSREGLWVGRKQHDYSLTRAEHWSTKQLQHPDGISELRGILGRRALVKR